MNDLTLSNRVHSDRSFRKLMGRGYYRIAAALAATRDRLQEVPGLVFDTWHGVDTSAMVQLSDLVIPDDAKTEAVRYQATKLGVFYHLLRRLPVNDLGRFAFVDYGCGKGRCLLLAARAGFGRAIGVELSKPLCEIASKNAARFQGGRFASRISIECVHSADAPIPDQPAVYYFYNPFGRQAMTATMRSIAAHADETGHEAYVIYVNPVHEDVIGEAGFHIAERGRRQNEDWAIWHWPGSISGRSAKAA